MKLELKLKTRNDKDDGKYIVKKPSDVYDKCPHCRSVNILKVDEEVLCNSCGWNSIAIHAECLLRAEEKAHARKVQKKRMTVATSKSNKTKKPAPAPETNPEAA